MRRVTLVLVGLIAGQVFADEFTEDFGMQGSFGSAEQMEALQAKVQDGCEVVYLKYQQRLPNGAYRDSGFLLDIGAQQALRYNTVAGQTSWEGWRGFSRDQLLEDDPSDGNRPFGVFIAGDACYG